MKKKYKYVVKAMGSYFVFEDYGTNKTHAVLVRNSAKEKWRVYCLANSYAEACQVKTDYFWCIVCKVEGYIKPVKAEIPSEA